MQLGNFYAAIKTKDQETFRHFLGPLDKVRDLWIRYYRTFYLQTQFVYQNKKI